MAYLLVDDDEDDLDRWNETQSAIAMLTMIGTSLSDRKLRLFACAYCRQIWDLMSDECRDVVILMEAYADSAATNVQVNDAIRKAASGPDCLGKSTAIARLYRMKAVGLHEDYASTFDLQDYIKTARNAGFAFGAAATVSFGHSDIAEQNKRFFEACDLQFRTQCALLRDIVGDPLRKCPPAPISIAIENQSVRSLAAKMYTNATFDQMFFLGDLLEVTGFHDREVLSHCRAASMHVRGC